MDIVIQLIWLLILPIPIACITWTITHEEVFREPREYCSKKSTSSGDLYTRKFFYLFTCEYCFSHYVSFIFILVTNFKLLTINWSGYFIAVFAVVWVANVYMSLFAMIRQKIKMEKSEIIMIDAITEL